MTLGMVQSLIVIIGGVLAIAILLRVLFVVHRQARKFKEMETRLRAMEKLEATGAVDANELKEV